MRRPALCALFLVLSIGCTSTQPSPSVAVELTEGRIVAGTVQVFEDVLRQNRGIPVVVNFWATWCEPCRREMPLLVDAAHAYQGEVRFIGINVEDDQDAATEFIAGFETPFGHLSDPKGEIRRSQNVVGLPVTQFYRADGELAFVHNGEISEADLEEKITELLRIGQPVG